MPIEFETWNRSVLTGGDDGLEEVRREVAQALADAEKAALSLPIVDDAPESTTPSLSPKDPK